MFLRELLKDRFYSGINHWLDQTLGPVVSTLASSALWIIWMAAFGAVLLAVWRFSHLQQVLDANAVPQTTARLAAQAGPAAAVPL